MTERVILDNTLRGRGFAREVDGRYYGPSWLRPPERERDEWRPVVWAGVFALTLVTLAAVAFALPSLLGAAIQVGDWLGITARPR